MNISIFKRDFLLIPIRFAVPFSVFIEKSWKIDYFHQNEQIFQVIS